MLKTYTIITDLEGVPIGPITPVYGEAQLDLGQASAIWRGSMVRGYSSPSGNGIGSLLYSCVCVQIGNVIFHLEPKDIGL